VLDFLEYLKSKKYSQLLIIKTIKFLSNINRLLIYSIKNRKKCYFPQNYEKDYSSNFLNNSSTSFAH